MYLLQITIVHLNGSFRFATGKDQMLDHETPDACDLSWLCHWRGEADEYTDLSLEQEQQQVA